MLRPWPVPQEDVNLLKEYNMAKLLIESEYDMDVALAETIKLVKLKAHNPGCWIQQPRHGEYFSRESLYNAERQ